MADFCRGCTGLVFGAEYADRNDLRHQMAEGGWMLCEHCGIHLFWTDGARLCQRPDVEHNGVAAAFAYPDPCPECVVIGEVLRSEEEVGAPGGD